MIFPWAFHVFTKSCGWNHHKSYDFLSAWVPITNFKCLNPTIDHQSFTVEKIPKHIWWLIVGLRLFIFWWIPLCFSPIFHCWIPSHPNRSGSRPCSPGHSRRFRSSQGSPEPWSRPGDAEYEDLGVGPDQPVSGYSGWKYTCVLLYKGYTWFVHYFIPGWSFSKGGPFFKVVATCSE